MAKWMVGTHGGTYGGNIMGCAAAVATNETILEEGLVQNAAERGEQLRDGLQEMQSRFPVIGDVRGLGLMVGVEFTDPQTRQPAAELTSQILRRCQEDERLILMNCGTYANTIRWIPPLVVSSEQLNESLHSFERALTTVLSQG
jgi:4-aminobutyrate aminotransferase-like enzyme